MTTPELFSRRLPASADQLRGVRAAIRSWLGSWEAPGPLRQRLLLATGEALTNAVEHAYLDGEPGTIYLEIAPRDGSLEVEIRDHGRWREWPGEPRRGRGFGVIRAVTEEFERKTSGTGTTVSFRLRRGEGSE